MFTNYLKITIRNLLRHKGFSAINISGLAIGLTCCALIMLWVVDELNFDGFHKNSQNIYRLYHELQMGGSTRVAPSVGAPTPKSMKEEFPEVIDATLVSNIPKASFEYEDKLFFEQDGFFADNSFLNVFSYEMINGVKESALELPYSIVLTKELASKYFGDENPIGQTLKVESEDYTVTGVLENTPRNTHIPFQYLISFETLYTKDKMMMDMWGRIAYSGYLLLANNTDVKALESKFTGLVEKHMGEGLSRAGASITFFMQPLDEIHLYSNFMFDGPTIGDISNVYLFSGIAFFILLIASINFINLSTARSGHRSKEVGMRKTFGADKNKLIIQFLGESLLLSILALILSLALIQLALPLFNQLTMKDLSFNYLTNGWFSLSLIGLTLFIALTAGAYPAFYLSSFNPIRVLKGNIYRGNSKSKFRSALVVFQFTISIVLVAGTLIINEQINYMKSKELGFNKDQVLITSISNEYLSGVEAKVEGEFKNIPNVKNVSVSTMIPGFGHKMLNLLPEGYEENDGQLMSVLEIDENFIPAYDMEIVKGRNFSSDMVQDKQTSALINETAARQFGWEDPIGKKFYKAIHTPEGRQQVEMTVIGVVKDFHLVSLHEEIGAVYIDNVNGENIDIMGERLFLSFKVAPANITSTIDKIKEKWQTVFPGRPFDYSFLDETFNQQYQAEENFGNLTLYFCILAIFIACLGLYGMASFTAEQRTKEIGIRKVLGASVPGILRILSKEIIILVSISNLLACPIAYYFMNRWLDNFAYRTSIGAVTFLVSGLLALLIAIITVSYQSLKVASSNPVDVIKYE